MPGRSACGVNFGKRTDAGSRRSTAGDSKGPAATDLAAGHRKSVGDMTPQVQPRDGEPAMG
jgi:hypothetical protein